MRNVAAGVIVMLSLAACGGEPSDRVAVPGAPPGGDTRPPASTVASASTTTNVSATTTTNAKGPATSTTTAVPTTTVAGATAPTTTPPVTTAPAATTIAPATTVLVYSPEPTEGPLRTGVEGPRSLQVQQQLIALAILPSTAADSKYGPGTAAGVRRFQESKGLVVDGVAGPNTFAALAAAVAALTPPTSAA